VPTFDPALLDFLESCVLDKWEGAPWREVFGDLDPLRPNLRAARWNPPGVEALYCSLTRETARAQVDHLVRLQSVPVRRRRSVQLDVELTRVVDLQDLDGLGRFGLEGPELTGKDVAAPRSIGQAVSWLGCAGLLVPSVRHSGTNLVIYTNQMAPSDRAELV